MASGNGQYTSDQSRRDILKAGVGALGGLSIAEQLKARELHTGSAQAQGTDTSHRPNLVFFLGEGLRPDQFSIAGNKLLRTPHMDRIGREGIRFENSFVTNSICLPSRASVLTGLFSHSTGCIDNRGRSVPAKVPIISDILREAGYESAFFGKAHIKDLCRRDWDYFLGFEDAGANYYHPVAIESRRGVLNPPRRFNGYVDDVLTDQALEWMKGRTKPFCLFFWFVAPHAPFYRPRRYLDLFNGVPIPKPSTFDDDLKGYPSKPRAFAEADNKVGTTIEGDTVRSLEELVKDHYAGVLDNDDNVGRIMNALEEAGTLDDTAILLSSDHGFFLGEWRMYDKRFMHEPSIRIPLMIRYPRVMKAGITCEKMALNVDLAPTILELAGVTNPPKMHGRSLLPFAKGFQPANWRNDWLYEYYEYPGPNSVKRHRGVRTERYKLIHYYRTPEEFEFYDLKEDPEEVDNRYGDPHYSNLIKRLFQRIDELRKETEDTEEY